MKETRSSSLPRLALCPGSALAEKGIENISGEPAKSGTRVHNALEELITIENMVSLSELRKNAQIIAEIRNLSDRETFITRWFAEKVYFTAESHGGVLEVFKEREMRIEFPQDDTAATMHPDLGVKFRDQEFHVFEYKTGFCAQDLSDDHIQMQAYCVGFAQDFELDTVTGHVLAAGNDYDEIHTHTTFHREHLDYIRNRVRLICLAAYDEDSERTPTHFVSGCRYCRARGTDRCPESAGVYATTLHELSTDLSEIDVMVSSLSTEQKGQVLSKWIIAKSIGDRYEKIMKAQIKEARDAGTESPVAGWTMTDDRMQRTLSDPATVIGLLTSQSALTRDQIIETATLSLPKIEKLGWEIVRDAARAGGSKPPKKKEVTDQICDIVSPCIEMKPISGSLKPVKD